MPMWSGKSQNFRSDLVRKVLARRYPGYEWASLTAMPDPQCMVTNIIAIGGTPDCGGGPDCVCGTFRLVVPDYELYYELKIKPSL